MAVLSGVKAFVDVRSKHDNHSQAVSNELRKLGAEVYSKFLPTVTHVIFKDGAKNTVTKASRFGAHLVTVQWIESCKANNERVSEFLHRVELTNSARKKQKSMQPKDFDEELKSASEKLSKVKKRNSDVQIPPPISIIADRINLDNYNISVPRTPPAMQKQIEELRERKSKSTNKIVKATGTPRIIQNGAEADLGNSPILRPSQKAGKHNSARISPVPLATGNDMSLCIDQEDDTNASVLPESPPSPGMQWDESIDMFLADKVAETSAESSLILSPVAHVNNLTWNGSTSKEHENNDSRPAPAAQSKPGNRSSLVGRKGFRPPFKSLAIQSLPQQPTGNNANNSVAVQSINKEQRERKSVSNLLKLHSQAVSSQQVSGSTVDMKPRVTAGRKSPSDKLKPVFSGKQIVLLRPRKLASGSPASTLEISKVASGKENTPVYIKRKGRKSMSGNGSAASSNSQLGLQNASTGQTTFDKPSSGIDSVDELVVPETQSSRSSLSSQKHRRSKKSSDSALSTSTGCNSSVVEFNKSVFASCGSEKHPSKSSGDTTVGSLTDEVYQKGYNESSMRAQSGSNKRKSYQSFDSLSPTSMLNDQGRSSSKDVKFKARKLLAVSGLNTTVVDSSTPTLSSPDQSCQPKKKSAGIPMELSDCTSTSSAQTPVRRSTSSKTRTKTQPTESTSSDKQINHQIIQSCEDAEAPAIFCSIQSNSAHPNGDSAIEVCDSDDPPSTTIDRVKSRINKLKSAEKTAGSKDSMNSALTSSNAMPACTRSIVLTSLHSGDRGLVKSIIKKLGGFHIKSEADSTTTHVVCGDERRTMNALRGISYGCWVVSVDWVLSSLDHDSWIDNEEDYLMSHAFPGASMLRRNQILSNKNKLLSTVGPIYVANQTTPNQRELVHLITISGGKVVTTRRACKIIVGRQNDCSNRRVVVKESWILDCVSNQRLLDYKPYRYKAVSESSSSDDGGNDTVSFDDWVNS